MAILILKHNALTPYANLESAKVGIIEKMATAQQGELWSAEYFTAASEGVEETKGAILAFKGKNGIVTFTDSSVMSDEIKTALSEYYTKEEIDAVIDAIVKSAIGVVGGDGIVISGEGTEKTISTNVELEIKTIEGKEMIQLLDATDNSKVLAEVDASKFVVDGMLDSASIVTINDETELPEGVELPNGKYIKLTWNTDAGKSDTYVPVADLISEHKVVAGEDVAGEFVVVATNVVESTDENGIKVSTVNVTVDDTAVKSALNKKIGKEDVMLTVGGKVQTLYTINAQNPSTPYILSGSEWSIQITSDRAYVSFDLVNSKDEIVLKWQGEDAYLPISQLTHKNGILSADIEIGPGGAQEITIDSSESYKMVYNTERNDNEDHQFYINLDVETIESETLNTEQSLNYLLENTTDVSEKINEKSTIFSHHYYDDGAPRRVNTKLEKLYIDKFDSEGNWGMSNPEDMLNVDVVVTSKKIDNDGTVGAHIKGLVTGEQIRRSINYDKTIVDEIDEKIGKEDVMLTIGGDTTYVLNRSTSETPVVLTGASWRVEFECDHNYFDIKLKNSKGEEVISYLGTGSYGTMGYMQHDNGILTSDVFENPSERQIDPNESYSIELLGRTHQYYEEQVTLTVKVKSNESQQVFNTEESIQYLNENKADKTQLNEVTEQVVSIEQQVNEKIGVNDGMLSITSDNGSKVENVNIESYGNYDIRDLHGDWVIIVKGQYMGGYNITTILSDPNRDGATIQATSNAYANARFVCSNGVIVAYGYNDDMGDWLQGGTMNASNSGHYQIGCGGHELNGTVEIQGISVETSLNTKQSFEYIDNIKADKVFVEEEVSTKIDKTDIMLSYGDLTTQEMGLGGGYSFYTPFVTGSYWQFKTNVQMGGYPSFNLLNSNGDVIYYFYGEGPYHKNLELTNEGGNLVIKSGNDGYLDGGVSSIKIESNEQYRLQALDGSIDNWVVITSLTNITELNTNESINYLNRIKSNKIEVEDSLNQLRINIDTKIGHEDTMLSFSTLTNEFTEEVVCDGTSDSFGSLTAGGNSWVFDVMLSNYGICSLCKANGNIEVYRYDANGPMEKNIRFTCNNGRLIIDYGFQPIEMDIEIEHDYRIILHSNSTANIKLSYFNSTNYTTKTSIEYLNEQIQNNTSNKLGKFDTVLSVNDGESNTEYNVEGALDYLNSEIQALNIINCGVY